MLSRQQAIAATRPHWPLIQEMAARFELDAYTLGALILVESQGNPRAVNKKSMAAGLMQVLPREAVAIYGDHAWLRERPSQGELRDPRRNLLAGCDLWYWLRHKHRADYAALRYYSSASHWKSAGDYNERYWGPLQEYRAMLEADQKQASALRWFLEEATRKLEAGDAEAARKLLVEEATPLAYALEGVARGAA